MSDSEFVASILAGDPEGLAAAYDKYAGDLYGYCQSLLQDQHDAADAVQDTFVIAASKLAGLRDPERLRAWLFAVARNECLHRLKSRRAAASLSDAPEPADDADIGIEAERAETVALIRAAVGGLNDGERDVINQLWHGLEVAEVAAVLGVSRNHAYTLFSRARNQLAASVGVLLVGRAGRRDCATLDSLLGDWDGRLTALLRKRVGRHIERCQVCSDRRRKELTPALLYGVTPGALLAMAGLRGGTALTAARKLAEPLSAVRDQVLRPADGPASHAAAFRVAGGRSATSFGTGGFPKPARYGHLGGWQLPHVPLAVAGGTVVTAAAVTALAVVPHPRPTPGSSGGGRPGGAPGSGGASASAPANVISGGPPTPADGTAASGPGKRGGTASAPGSPGSPTGPGPTGPTAASPTAPGGGSTGPARAPAVPASGAPTSAPTVAPTAAVSASGSSPSAGTLAVSATTVLLSPLLGGSLTLTASGGPVSWSVSEPASLLGKLAVSPASGSLSAGRDTTVTITTSGLVSLDTQVTVEPGGQLVTVVLGLG
jgi:RNA polymerase sigma factor (sigma-70 family)